MIACFRSASRSCSGTGFADDSSTLKPMSTREPPVCVFASPFTFFPLLSSIVGSGIAGSVGADAAFSSERSRASASSPGRIDLGGSRPGTKTDLTVEERCASILSLGRAYDTAPVSRFRQIVRPWLFGLNAEPSRVSNQLGGSAVAAASASWIGWIGVSGVGRSRTACFVRTCIQIGLRSASTASNQSSGIGATWSSGVSATPACSARLYSLRHAARSVLIARLSSASSARFDVVVVCQCEPVKRHDCTDSSLSNDSFFLLK